MSLRIPLNMKEDILEQIVDEYLHLKGYFTMANVKYKPLNGDPGYDADQDRIPSDIDVIGFHPEKTGPDKVLAVSCKSWQDGFWINWELNQLANHKKFAKKERWRCYRELANDKWACAFKRKVRELTGQSEFSHVIACLFVADHDSLPRWTTNEAFRRRLTAHLSILTLQDMFSEIHDGLSRTPGEVGRLLQVMKAAKIRLAA